MDTSMFKHFQEDNLYCVWCYIYIETLLVRIRNVYPSRFKVIQDTKGFPEYIK